MTILARYFLHAGRIPKSVWFARLLIAGVCASAFGLLAQEFAGMAASAAFAALFLLSAIAISVQRLHDAGQSGVWLVIAVLPVLGPILLLSQLLRSGVPGTNQYGPDPFSRFGYFIVDISK